MERCCFHGANALWNIAKKRMLEDREALPREDGDSLREYQAMHEETFSAVGGGRLWMVKNKERERFNKEARG